MLQNITSLETRLHQPATVNGIHIHFPLDRIDLNKYTEKYEVILTQKEEKIYFLLMPKHYKQDAKTALMLCN